jgi:NADPH:quinone reductase
MPFLQFNQATVFSLNFKYTAGMEAVGVVTAVGPGLTGRKLGDVVAYAGNPMGSYAQEHILPASAAIPVPPSIDHKVAASVMLKGMTAHVLVRRVFKVLISLFVPMAMNEYY